MLVNIYKFLDSESIIQCGLTNKFMRATALIPEVWKHFESEEDECGTLAMKALKLFNDKVTFLKAKYKQEQPARKKFNHVLFSLYNVVHLNLAGCQIIYNVDFLQVMKHLKYLDLSHVPTMSTSSLIRSVPTLSNLKVFIVMGNSVRVGAFTIHQCVRHLPTLEKLDCSDSGVMQPWVARKICWYGKGLKEFYFTTFWSLDNNDSKVSWYKLVKRKYPHIKFVQKVKDKVEEYIKECRAVRDEAMLDDWADDAVKYNPS